MQIILFSKKPLTRFSVWGAFIFGYVFIMMVYKAIYLNPW